MSAEPVPISGRGTIAASVTRLKSQRRSAPSRTTVVPPSAAALTISIVAVGKITAPIAAAHVPKRVNVCIGSPF